MMGNGWSMGFGGIVMWLFWFAFILLIVWFVKGLFTRPDNQQPTPESARQILDRRLAQGEIDHSEYEEKKRLLDKP